MLYPYVYMILFREKIGAVNNNPPSLSKSSQWNAMQPVFICSKLTKSKVSNMFKVNNKSTRTMPLASFWCLCSYFEHISRLVLVFLLLTLNMYLPPGYLCKLTRLLIFSPVQNIWQKPKQSNKIPQVQKTFALLFTMFIAEQENTRLVQTQFQNFSPYLLIF